MASARISYSTVPWPDIDAPNDLLLLKLRGGPTGVQTLHFIKQIYALHLQGDGKEGNVGPHFFCIFCFFPTKKIGGH